MIYWIIKICENISNNTLRKSRITKIIFSATNINDIINDIIDLIWELKPPNNILYSKNNNKKIIKMEYKENLLLITPFSKSP